MSAPKIPTAILISGEGSNMEALIDAAQAPDYPAQITLVISNRPGAKGLERARAKNIPTMVIDHKIFETREAFDDALNQALENANIELICNAGFKRLLTKGFVEKWHNRQLNIHPSLLPAFKGLNTHERALETDVKITGCTVHFVRFDMDSGPIITQAAVPIFCNDTAQTLQARVLKAEHKIYPESLKLVASGLIRVSGEKIIYTNKSQQEAILISPTLS